MPKFPDKLVKLIYSRDYAFEAIQALYKYMRTMQGMTYEEAIKEMYRLDRVGWLKTFKKNPLFK